MGPRILEKMKDNIFISIITPTYNRADELIHLFRSISEQTYPLGKIECIISDDGSDDDTETIVKEWQGRSLFDIIYLTQENKGPGAARNHGLEKSSGDLILFIDSDCEAHPKWIETIVSTYRDNDFDACGGPDGSKGDFTVLQKAIDFSMTSFFTTGGMRGHSEKMIAKFYPRTHNMGISRSIYEAIGGFGDLRHGQDIEYSNRIHRSGAKVCFIKDALVYHRRRTSLKQFTKQVINWGIARVNLGKIDLNMLELVHFLPSIVCLFSMIIISFTLYIEWTLQEILSIFFIPLAMISLFGVVGRRDPKLFPFLLVVIPVQIIGYGVGFLYAFFRRFIFGKSEIVGFKKSYYK